jgi:hypothetical protein
MGPFDIPGTAGLVDTIVRLVKSPRVQYGARQLRNTAPMAAQPLRLPGSISGMGGRPGASQRFDAGAAGKSVGGALGGLSALFAGGGGAQQQSDPLMDLYQQLIGQLQAPVAMPTGIDTENLMAQVQKAINPIYDQRINEARGDTERGTSEVKDMYRALSGDYERLAKEQQAQSEQAKMDIEAMYGQLRSNIKGDYARVSKEQSDLFKQLGIEEALPEVLEEQSAPVEEALIAASQNQTQQQQRYEDIGNIDESYWREGSPLATMTGNEISVDMLNDLQDYVQQTNAERTAGIQSGYLDQLSQAQNQLLQQQQMAQGEAGRRQEMLWQMLQSQLQGGQQQELTVDSFMAGLPPQMQQSVAGAFTKLSRAPEAVYGKVKDPRNPVPGTFVETTPNWYLAQADEMLKRGEIDPTTHQALVMYLQLYHKMGSR